MRIEPEEIRQFTKYFEVEANGRILSGEMKATLNIPRVLMKERESQKLWAWNLHV